MKSGLLLILVAALFTCVSCDRAAAVGAYLGVTDAPVATPLTIDILVDYGSHAPGTPENLDAAVVGVLSQVADHPGTTLRLFWLGNAVGESRLVSTYVVPPSPKQNLRTRQAHAEEVVAEGSRQFRDAAAPLFADFRRRRTPLIETIARIALAGNPTGGRRVTLALTDLREESELFGTFECGPLPERDAFLAAVATVLPQDSLRDTSVIALYSAPDPVDGDRCPVRIDRFRAITDLFATAIAQAGGSFQLCPTSIPTIERRPS